MEEEDDETGRESLSHTRPKHAERNGDEPERGKETGENRRDSAGAECRRKRMWLAAEAKKPAAGARREVGRNERTRSSMVETSQESPNARARKRERERRVKTTE